jgi:NADH dehydrogenase
VGIIVGLDSLHAVTGAFGYTGRYIAGRLLYEGKRVITLTNSANKENLFEGRIKAFPLDFSSPDNLAKSLQDVSVLYNTYWVRFNHKSFNHADAIRNTKTLFSAAKKANVKRIVHISITNPSKDSHLEYFRGKAILESELLKTGLTYSILRPTVIFGREDILINNIAWLLRHIPVFGVFGKGDYRLQPIYVDDLAMIAVNSGEKEVNEVINCIGQEAFTYRDLVKLIAFEIGRNIPVISISPKIGSYFSKMLGKLINDVLITSEEIDGLMSELLYVDSEPAGNTKFSEWLRENAVLLGRQYSSELNRREKEASKSKHN